VYKFQEKTPQNFSTKIARKACAGKESMIDFYSKPRYGFQDLLQLVRVLRAADGCPWDRVQTHDSIRRNFLEEVYEACEAIDRNDPELLREELGDVLLHVVFHASIEEDAGRFTIDDVCDTVVKKMVFRHPALFGEADLDWDEIKRREKGQKTLSQELDAVARSLPALWRAEKLQNKAEKAGEKLPTETEDWAGVALNGPEDLGKALFGLVRQARRLGLDPEQALQDYCDTFLTQVEKSGRDKQNVQAEGSAEYEKEKCNHE
jgi:tetrapyrrole methylase family protein/MazG family protein